MRNFRTLDIWKEGIEITREIYENLDYFPNRERYGLLSQICRSAVSIPSNIAEGASRDNKEYKRFLSFALGSSFELETQLIIASQIGYFKDEICKDLLLKLNVLQRRINSFRNSLK